MNVADIMTRDVITVAPTASIHEAARRMVEHGVSGLPVVNAQGVAIGIITEGDLILRQKAPAVKRRSWWTLFFSDPDRLAREYQRAAGITVAEVMSPDVVWVGPDWPVESVASMLDRLHIRRMPVLDASGLLAGIVSRADLIKALAVAPPRTAAQKADAGLAAEMRRRLATEEWISTSRLSVEALHGVIWISGTVESEVERSAIETMARAVEGCRGVTNGLAVRRELDALV
jgi:CBS domain-containing protein